MTRHTQWSFAAKGLNIDTVCFLKCIYVYLQLWNGSAVQSVVCATGILSICLLHSRTVLEWLNISNFFGVWYHAKQLGKIQAGYFSQLCYVYWWGKKNLLFSTTVIYMTVAQKQGGDSIHLSSVIFSDLQRSFHCVTISAVFKKSWHIQHYLNCAYLSSLCDLEYLFKVKIGNKNFIMKEQRQKIYHHIG